MKTKEIRDLTTEELIKKVADLKGELFNLRFRLATGQLDNPMTIKDVKRTIARVQRANRKIRIGHVVSDKMDKTVVVRVETKVRHPLYGRIIKQSKKFKAHDENNESHIGDKVKIMETRPLSKEKRWRVVEILEKAPIV
jgi:small subunit ribosomal protein S17